MESTNPQSLTVVHIEQPAALTSLLQELLQKDTYNKFCIDCNRNESTHASVTFGVFICEDCATQHIQILGMDRSYVKPVFGDLWDAYATRVIQLGGNKKLWDFLKLYNGLEQKPIAAKYTSSAALYYKRKLAAEGAGQPFDEKEPAKNAEELFDRGVDSAKSVAKSAGEGISKGFNVLGDKLAESGIKDKFKGLFGGKK